MEATADNVDLQDADDEEASETLSFRELPLTSDESQWTQNVSNDSRRSNSEHEFFEFFSGRSSEMCPADDLIFCGKLRPFKQLQDQEKQQRETLFEENNKTKTKQDWKPFVLQRRSESLNELESSRYNNTKARVMRISRSLDYQKLSRNSSMDSGSADQESDRNSSSKCFGKSDMSVGKSLMATAQPKSRWYMMFGSVRIPPEMELRDIKSRQVRRNSLPLVQALEAEEKATARRSSGKGSWGFLRALTCKNDDTSTAVTSSIRCISHV